MVEVDVLELIAILTVQVLDPQHRLGEQLTLVQETKLVLVRGLEVAVDQLDVRHRVQAAAKAGRLDDAVAATDTVEHEVGRRGVQLDQRNGQEDLVVVATRAGRELGLAVAPGIPGKRQERRHVRVLDVDVLGEPLLRPEGTLQGDRRERRQHRLLGLTGRPDQLGHEIADALVGGERLTEQGVTRQVRVLELVEVGVAFRFGIQRVEPVGVYLLAVDAGADGDHEVVGRLDLILEVDAPVGGGRAGTRLLRDGRPRWWRG